MKHRRAFSLMEVAVASAMAGLIGAAAISAFAALNRQLVRIQSESIASDNAKSMIDLLVTDLQGVGGGPIRPWMALWVENGTNVRSARDAAFNSPPVARGVFPDRVTYAALIPEAPSCPISALTPTTVNSSPGTLASCCLGQLSNLGTIPGTESDGPFVEAFLIKDDDHRQVVITEVDLVACTARFIPGPMSPIDRLPATGNVGLIGGTVVAASVQTLYLTKDNELRLLVEQRGFDAKAVAIEPDESTRVAGDIYDVQFQLGFDRELDGRITDTRSATDEWLFNDAGDDAASFQPTSLRMVGVGVIVGVTLTDPNYRSAAIVTGGSVVVGNRVHLRGSMGRAALRNLFIFF